MTGDGAWARERLGRAAAKLRVARDRIGATFPHAATDGRYDARDPAWWTAGFWPGMLWLLYEADGDPSWRRLAEALEERLHPLLGLPGRLHHDVGFMWMLTAVARHRLTAAEDARAQALLAATYLAGRFNPAGRYLRAWADTAEERRAGWAIIDTVMNLPLLDWASRAAGDPRFQAVARAHTETVLAHFCRPDGSVRHIVVFNPATGAVDRVLGGQGASPESAWARGTAWALYGLALGYAYRRDPPVLAAARRTAHFFMAALPEDGVPPWDFRSGRDEAPRDTSAAAIAASGLLELARWVPPADAALYERAARRLMAALDGYLLWDPAVDGLLGQGVSHLPQGTAVGVPLIYGDYFWLEALTRMAGGEGLFYRSPPP
jgi:unsaturated chondroitin disaccharide hydrolase